MIGALFSELRRRRVLRVAAAYVAAAWVAIEAADVIFPHLAIPESAVRVVIVVAMLGFPLVVALAWTFDLTPAGVVRTPARSEAPKPAPRFFGRGFDFALIALLAIALGYFITREPPQSATPASPSIAVLPFVDLSPQGDSEYFSDGVAEELLNVLAGVQGLRVAARTSSFSFKEGDVPADEIGRRLDVSTLLEGSVRKDARSNRVRVTAQLINAADGFHLWSRTYEGALDDVFAIQDDIARAIADELRVTLLPETAAAAAPAAGTESVAAYDLYLKGRDEAHKRTAESLSRAREHFEQAISLDPDYALAYSGLADALSLLVDYGNARLEAVAPAVEAHISRALALEPGLGEAYASLGLLRLQQEDYPAAAEALRRALERAPENVQALMWYGSVLKEQERYRETLDAYQRAYDRDPLSVPLNVNLAYTYDQMGEHERAQRHWRGLVELRPEDAGAYRNELANSHHWDGNLVDAVRWSMAQLAEDPRDVLATARLVEVYTDLGERDVARRWLERGKRLEPAAVELADAEARLLLAGERFDDHLALVRGQVAAFERRLADMGLGPPLGLYARRAVAEHLAGNPAAARADFERALQTTEVEEVPVVWENVDWLPFLAVVYREQGERDGFEALVARVLEFVDARISAGIHTGDLHAQRARLLALTGRDDAVRREIETARDFGFLQIYYAAGLPGFAAPAEQPWWPAFERSVAAILERQRARLAGLALPQVPEPSSGIDMALEPGMLDRYAGRYEADKAGPLIVTRVPAGLHLLVPGVENARLAAQSANEFFVTGSSAVLTFAVDEDGRVTHALYRRGGADDRAVRVETPPERAVHAIPPAALDDYTGRYRLEGTNDRYFVVEREGDRLYGRFGSDFRVAMIPWDRDVFGNALYNAEARFSRDRGGRVVEALLVRDGSRLRATRVAGD